MPTLSEVRRQLEQREMERDRAARSMAEIRALFLMEPSAALDAPEIDAQINAWMNRLGQIDDIIRTDSEFLES